MHFPSNSFGSVELMNIYKYNIDVYLYLRQIFVLTHADCYLIAYSPESTFSQQFSLSVRSVQEL